MEISVTELKDLLTVMTGSETTYPLNGGCYQDQFLDIPPKNMKSLIYKWMKVHVQDEHMVPSFVDEMFRIPFDYYVKNTTPDRIECKKHEYSRARKRKRNLEDLSDEEKKSMTDEQIFEWEFKLTKTFVWDPYWRECFADRFGRIPRMENT